MQGEIVISTNRGWSCSNEAYIDIESDVIRDPITDKATSSTRTTVAISKGTYSVVDELHEGDAVECLFEIDSGKMITFVGKIRQVLKNTVWVVVEGSFKDGKDVKDLANKIDNTFN